MVLLCIEIAAAAVILIKVSFEFKCSVNKMVIVFTVAPVALYHHTAFYKEIVIGIIHFYSSVGRTVYCLAVFVLAYRLQPVILCYFKSAVIEIKNAVLLIVVSADYNFTGIDIHIAVLIDRTCYIKSLSVYIHAAVLTEVLYCNITSDSIYPARCDINICIRCCRKDIEA